MLIKEILHRQILSAYFLLLKLLNRNPPSTSNPFLTTVKNTVSTVETELTTAVQKTVEKVEEEIESVVKVVTDAEGRFEQFLKSTGDEAADARRALARVIDPDTETPHVGDVSGEIGGIDWEDAVPYTWPNVGNDRNLGGSAPGIHWDDRDKE